MFINLRHFAATITAALSITFAGGFTSTASADVYNHLDRVALRILKKSERLVKETEHYRNTPQYRHLLSDAREMCKLATHIHEVTHFEGNLRQLQRDVYQLDQVFHHVEGLFDQIERQAAYGIGHIRGNTRHVKNLLNQIEREIDCLHDDIAKIRRTNAFAAPVYQAYRPSPYGYGFSLNDASRYHRGSGSGCSSNRSRHGYDRYGVAPYHTARGLSIGGGSSRIWIGF